MYIRWQSRERSTPAFGRGQSDVHWRAILVENVRVYGKPRQQHIAYVAGFTESAVAIPIQRLYVWDRVTERLDHLGSRISREDRRRIEAALSVKIGKRPTAEQRAKLEEERDKRLASLANRLAKL